jgi:hypothetical protein
MYVCKLKLTSVHRFQHTPTSIMTIGAFITDLSAPLVYFQLSPSSSIVLGALHG